MRNRKTIFTVLILLLLLAFPTIVLANSVAPDPNAHELLIDDVTDIDSLTVFGYDENGFEKIMADFYSMDDERLEKTRNGSERIIDLYNSGGASKGFRLEIVFENGETQTSQMVNFVGDDSYTYSVRDNEFTGTGTFKTRKPGGLQIAFWVFMLVIPWGLTVLLEWLVALIFKIKPSRYVCFTNLVSNPVMNIVLLVVMSNFIINYFWLVLILELLIVGFEFLFYTFRYKDISKRRLLLFTFAANAVSFGTYAIVSGLFY